MSLTAFRARVRGVHKVPIGNSAPLTEAEETESITAALQEYGRQVPRRQVAYGTVPESLEVAITSLVATWSDSSNQIEKIRIHVGTIYERTLDSRDYLYSQRSGGAYLQFLAAQHAGEAYAIHYTGPHSVVDTPSPLNTIPDADQAAVVQLAASYVLANAGNKFALNANSSISADAVSQGEQSKAYSFQSKDARAAYERHIAGVKVGRSARIAFDLEYHNGRGRMFNRRCR